MRQSQLLPIPKVTNKHIGKPMKIQLKNGKALYGTVKEIRKDGIIFLSVQ